MKRNSKAVFILGCLLIICSAALFGFLQLQAKQAADKNDEIVQTIESVLPERREGIIDEGQKGNMPALELQGEDFIALLEIPACSVKLPVCGSWDKADAAQYPCRFYGSACSGTLVIGGYDQAGQFDFFDRIANGEQILLTDMTGCQFTYEVARIDRSDDAPAEKLINDDTELTLFVRDVQYLEYIILRCEAK